MLDIINSYDKLIQETSELARTLKIYPKVFDKEEFHEQHKFFDKALFTVLNHLDLIIGLKYLDVSQAIGNQPEANYFARDVILTSHEILNDLNKMLGKNIRTKLIEKNGANGLEELDDATKEMNDLRKKYLKKLKDLRNNVLAHKLEHGHQQAELIISINNKEIYRIGNEIFKAQTKFLENFFFLITSIKKTSHNK